MTNPVLEICQTGPVIPVVEVENPADAGPLAHALLNGGIAAIEITLRTDKALEAIATAALIEGLKVGAGTLRSSDDVRLAKEAGASFGVSPGSSPELISACRQHDLPLLPGAATASEVMALAGQGFMVQKFFPAAAAGGPAMLKALAGPFADILFCPTGGISQTNAPEYLGVKNVVCVGGSWIAPRSLIADQNWSRIEQNAAEAASLR